MSPKHQIRYYFKEPKGQPPYTLFFVIGHPSKIARTYTFEVKDKFQSLGEGSRYAKAIQSQLEDYASTLENNKDITNKMFAYLKKITARK